MERLQPETSLLLVVDVQERLAAAMPAPAHGAPGRELRGSCWRRRAVLRIPVVASEQYPKGLGPTVRADRDRLSRCALAWVQAGRQG